MTKITILIVEDEILIADLITKYLLERGHSVVGVAISYNQAVELYNSVVPDLVLLDIRLYGNKSGIDFSRFLAEQPSAPPFVFLTSQFGKRVLDQALESRPNGYLTKPIIKESLWTTIESAVKLHGANYREITKIYDGQSYHLLPVEEIVYIQADHVYLNIHMYSKKVITTRSTIKKILDSIDSDFLLSCHRSYIINLKYITNWTLNELILNESIPIPLSRSRRGEVISKLG